MGLFNLSSYPIMQIFVNCQREHVLEVSEDATIDTVRRFIVQEEGIPVSAQFLMNQGRLLEEGTLASHGIHSLSTISVGVRVLGGKVHGSLARAGKVKGQTPKVEPGEKKKKKTGRAKRRMQYNKRFKETVPFGQRKR